MKIEIRSDSVTIEGYVNAVERASKPLNSRLGKFVEKICAGAFKRALSRNNNVRILLNHDWTRDLGGTKEGNLELEEDNIGLHARAVISDPEVIRDARNGDLVGWSFGFDDLPNGVTETRDEETGLPFRKVKDLNLVEVSLLNRKRSPAYVGTLVNVRDESAEPYFAAEDYEPENIEVVDLTEKQADEQRAEETPEATPEAEATPAETKEVSSEYFARYRSQIDELKKLVNN